MGYVPKDARWFVAELIVEIKIDGNPRNVVHINTVLVNADSPEHAYQRANELGATYNSTTENESGHAVHTSFLGLRDLFVMYDEPVHGAEVFYEEKVGVEQAELSTFIRGKESLTVFIPWEPPSDNTPDYAVGRIVRDMREELGSKT